MKARSLSYTELVAKLRTLKPGSPEHSNVWFEIEQLKNSNGGQVPEFEDFADQSELLGK